MPSPPRPNKSFTVFRDDHIAILLTFVLNLVTIPIITICTLNFIDRSPTNTSAAHRSTEQPTAQREPSAGSSEHEYTSSAGDFAPRARSWNDIASQYQALPAEGGSITVGSDITVNEPRTVFIIKPLILDLNGHTINVNVSQGIGIAFSQKLGNRNIPLQIKNGRIRGQGSGRIT